MMRWQREFSHLAESIGVKQVLHCDVTNDEDIRNVFAQIAKVWDGVDILIHSVAFANREELKGSFLNTSRLDSRLPWMSAPIH